MQEGNNVAEYHSSEFFPERWFQAVYVVRCDTDILFKRLEHRGYNVEKIRNNVEYEIFQMSSDEAKSSYKKDIIFEVRGETEEQLEQNLEKVSEFLNNYKEDWYFIDTTVLLASNNTSYILRIYKSFIYIAIILFMILEKKWENKESSIHGNAFSSNFYVNYKPFFI